MKTRMNTAKMAALALLPLLGCGVLAWQGAHRPEKMILGRWRVNETGSTIEFKPDGTYLSLSKVEPPVPGGTWARRSSARVALVRFWGRYRFLDRRHLQLQPLRMQEDDKPAGAIASAAQDFLPEIEVRIEDGQVQVFTAYRDPAVLAQTWTRIE